MDCKAFSNLLDAYLDGSLSDAEARGLRAHAAECPSCAALLALRQDLRRMDEDVEVPGDFSSSWRQRVKEEKSMEEKARKKGNWKAWASVAAALVFVIGGTLMSRDGMTPRTVSASRSAKTSPETAAMEAGGGLNGSYYRSADAGMYTNFAYESAATMAEDYDAAEYETAEETAVAKAEKIIRSASFTIKTTDYEADLENIQRLAQDMGGRVEYLSSSGDAASGQTRSASLTLRIPSQRLDEFLEGAQGVGTVTAMTQEMEDVSDSYYDVQSRLETQREKLKRLQSMIQSAEDVSDLIEIEAAIADTQYYIDRYAGQIKSYDSKVDYSTVRVTVREYRATELKEVTLGQRILDGLQSSIQEFGWFMEDMVIFLVSVLPWIAMLAVLIAAVSLIVRRNKKKKERKQGT